MSSNRNRGSSADIREKNSNNSDIYRLDQFRQHAQASNFGLAFSMLKCDDTLLKNTDIMCLLKKRLRIEVEDENYTVAALLLSKIESLKDVYPLFKDSHELLQEIITKNNFLIFSQFCSIVKKSGYLNTDIDEIFSLVNTNDVNAYKFIIITMDELGLYLSEEKLSKITFIIFETWPYEQICEFLKNSNNFVNRSELVPIIEKIVNMLMADPNRVASLLILLHYLYDPFDMEQILIQAIMENSEIIINYLMTMPLDSSKIKIKYEHEIRAENKLAVEKLKSLFPELFPNWANFDTLHGECTHALNLYIAERRNEKNRGTPFCRFDKKTKINAARKLLYYVSDRDHAFEPFTTIEFDALSDERLGKTVTKYQNLGIIPYNLAKYKKNNTEIDVSSLGAIPVFDWVNASFNKSPDRQEQLLLDLPTEENKRVQCVKFLNEYIDITNKKKNTKRTTAVCLNLFPNKDDI